MIATGFPTRYGDVREYAACAVPRVFLHSTHDEFGPQAELQAFVDSLSNAAIYFIEASDHFFAGGLDQLEQKVIQVSA